jgi:hypothetical protein
MSIILVNLVVIIRSYGCLRRFTVNKKYNVDGIMIRMNHVDYPSQSNWQLHEGIRSSMC